MGADLPLPRRRRAPIVAVLGLAASPAIGVAGLWLIPFFDDLHVLRDPANAPLWPEIATAAYCAISACVLGSSLRALGRWWGAARGSDQAASDRAWPWLLLAFGTLLATAGAVTLAAAAAVFAAGILGPHPAPQWRQAWSPAPPGWPGWPR